ncbi:MAG: phage portal protein [Clostridia bacterium]|nr:phage portal protein [Clostridia bacterium]
MSIWESLTENVVGRLNAGRVMSEKEFFEAEIARWRCDEKRSTMIDGERYFRGEHDILKAERTAIGKDGKLKKVDNLPNNRIVDNQYQRLVNQKVNYLLGREAVLDGESEAYIKLLKNALGENWGRMLKCLLRDAINMGVAWLFVYADEDGKVAFKRIPAYEVIAYWKDDGHTLLDKAVRIYQVEGYKGKDECVREMVEIYHSDRVEIFEWEEGVLRKCEEHTYFKEHGIPLVAFKYNEKEIPLIKRVKTLQDALNQTLSDFENNMQEDARNTIIVLQNYDGTDLGEFRQNLAAYGAVKVKTVDGAAGDIKTLTTDFKAENYSVIINLIKSSLIENAMGYDSKSDKLGNNPNQLVMKSMFSDLDLDMSEAEVEFRYSFNVLRKLLNEYFEIYGYGYFEEERANIIFNRDCLINESEAIDNCIKSREILSEESVLLQHPWVSDAKNEMKKRSGSSGER